MKTPQCEDGFTKIANELLDAILRHNFSKRELNIVLAVIRKTYGFNKKMDDISLSQLAKITGIQPQHISTSVRELVAKKVFLKQEGRYAQSIGLNKQYNEWMGFPKREGVPKTGGGGSQNRNKGVPKTGTTKDNSKRQYQKKYPTIDWRPNDQVLRWPTVRAIPKDFIEDSRAVFITYWQERELDPSEADGKFLKWVIRDWRQRGHQWVAPKKTGGSFEI